MLGKLKSLIPGNRTAAVEAGIGTVVQLSDKLSHSKSQTPAPQKKQGWKFCSSCRTIENEIKQVFIPDRAQEIAAKKQTAHKIVLLVAAVIAAVAAFFIGFFFSPPIGVIAGTVIWGATSGLGTFIAEKIIDHQNK